jgi:plastocyanin
VGTTVKFANKDGVAHTATLDTGVWDGGYLAKGEEFFLTFTEPGVFPYYCIPHGGPGGSGYGRGHYRPAVGFDPSAGLDRAP